MDGWPHQLDLRPVRPSALRQLENCDGEFTDTALAGYIAKYATKSTGAIADDGADRPSATATTSPTSTCHPTTGA